MKQRILSFVLLWTVFALLLVVFGIHGGIVCLAAVAFVTQLELYQLFEKTGLAPFKSLGLLFGVLIICGGYYLGGADAGNDLFLLAFLLLTLTIIRRDLQAGRLRSFMPTLFGLLYIPYLLHFLAKTAKQAEMATGSPETGLFLAIWVVVIAKMTDVGALLVGLRLGRTPLSVISPKKTYEGAAGGIAVAALSGLLLLGVFHTAVPYGFSWWLSVLLAIPVSIAAIASDLVESAFKRQAGVKDSGNLIPGIGGVFDLSDSLVLAAPLAYLLFKYTVF